LIVVLGATAGRALLGPSFRVGTDRGVPRPLPDAEGGTRVLATVHPSAVLRAQDRREMYAGLVADLRTAADAL
jgi:DNA polymerase